MLVSLLTLYYFWAVIDVRISTKSATTNQILSTVQVEYTIEQNPGGPSQQSNIVTTDVNGTSSLQVPFPSTVHLQANVVGYNEEAVTVIVDWTNPEASQAVTLSLSPDLDEGEVRLVLNWGKDPQDLDVYATQGSGHPLEEVPRLWPKPSAYLALAAL